MKQKIARLASKASDAINSTTNKLVQSETGQKLNEVSKKVRETYRDSGLEAKVETVTSTASENFDIVSGAKILQLVEERLAIQEKYNDILATKLEEALQRIATLEKASK